LHKKRRVGKASEQYSKLGQHQYKIIKKRQLPGYFVDFFHNVDAKCFYLMVKEGTGA